MIIKNDPTTGSVKESVSTTPEEQNANDANNAK